MKSSIFKEMIAVIRGEQRRRESLLADEDPNYADDRRLFTDGPFVNELCLMVLVALRHQAERELVSLAARAADGGKEISAEQFDKRRVELKTGRAWDWKVIDSRLKLESCEEYKCMEVLRHLANSFKHDFSKEPNEKLLSLLNLETGVRYAPLPESIDLCKGLAALAGLKEDASYCDITERLVDIASHFVESVKDRIPLSRVERRPVLLNPKHFAR